MKDNFVRALLCDGQVMASAISANDIVETAKKIHNTSPEATAALGRLLVAGLLMCKRLKDSNETLTLIVKGGGPAGQLIVTASSGGFVKGYIQNPHATAPLRADGKLNVGGIVGKEGTITVIRDNGKTEPYNGICNLVSGEIAEDIANYYASSEQLPTGVMLGVKLDKNHIISAGGLFVSPLPGCTESALEELEAKIKTLPPITELLQNYESLEEMLLDNFWDIGVYPLDNEKVEYKCDCTRERFLGALISVGKQDLTQLFEEADPVEMDCRFCGKTYEFYKSEIEGLWENKH